MIILTFNSEESIGRVIQACQPIASRILIVDSFSTDHTLDIIQSLNCEVTQHGFDNYSAQRNWAQSYANLDPMDWVLHLDSDEVMSPELCQSIQQTLETPDPSFDGYLVQRLSYFLGHPIRHGHLNPNWHLRLFRAGKGHCEDRLYDQHFIVPGSTQQLTGLLLDLQLTTLEKWTAAHNRWSTAEAQEVMQQTSPTEKTLAADLKGDPRMQKRWLKNNLYYRSPLLLRAFLFFLYSYFLKLGFLDGKIGLIYHFLQAFWFRFLVDAKVIESQLDHVSHRQNGS